LAFLCVLPGMLPRACLTYLQQALINRPGTHNYKGNLGPSVRDSPKLAGCAVPDVPHLKK
jgi:hypothetical protein